MPEDRLLSPEETAEMEEWFAQGEPSARELWKAMYGFDHDCRCEQDVEEGNLHKVPDCYLTMVDDAMQTLRALRGLLHVIATAETDNANVLKALARESLEPK